MSSIITHENSMPIPVLLQGFWAVLDSLFSPKRAIVPLAVALQANILLVSTAVIEKCRGETEL